MFGGYNSSLIKSTESNPVHWQVSLATTQWEISLSKLLFGDTKVSGNSYSVIVDSVEPLVKIPMQDFGILSTEWMKIFKQLNCSGKLCVGNGTCSLYETSLKSLTFQFLPSFRTNFNIPPSEYIFDGKNYGHEGSCVFGVRGSEELTNTYILGQAFLRNFYQVYDYEKLKVGLAIHLNSKATITYNTNYWYWVALIVGIIIVIALISYICY